VRPDRPSDLDRYRVSRESLERLEDYVALLLDWQKRINLIGESTAGRVWSRHIADALQIVPLLPPSTRSIADLGSGAGIPGVVLAIATGLHVHLYESSGKKAAFLREAIRLTAAPATVVQGRIETQAQDPRRPQVDAVVARALAKLPMLLDYAAPFLATGARGYFLKGQEIDAELAMATQHWKLRYKKHQSATDSRGVVLEIMEAVRVQARSRANR
jgi:16S rRNA (guanine527-N7)-methyltransferase